MTESAKGAAGGLSQRTRAQRERERTEPGRVDLTGETPELADTVYCGDCSDELPEPKRRYIQTAEGGGSLLVVCPVCALLNDISNYWVEVPRNPGSDGLVEAALTEIYLALRDRYEENLGVVRGQASSSRA